MSLLPKCAKMCHSFNHCDRASREIYEYAEVRMALILLQVSPSAPYCCVKVPAGHYTKSKSKILEWDFSFSRQRVIPLHGQDSPPSLDCVFE